VPEFAAPSIAGLGAYAGCGRGMSSAGAILAGDGMGGSVEAVESCAGAAGFGDGVCARVGAGVGVGSAGGIGSWAVVMGGEESPVKCW